MWWIERFLRGRARARRRRIPFTSITDFPFVFLFWRPLLVLGDPFDLGHYWSQPPKRSKAKERLLLKAFSFFLFFQIARQIYPSSSGQDRRHYVQARGKPLARRRTGEDAMRRKRRRFFADGNDLKSWKPLVLSTEEVAFVCAAGEIVTNEGVVTRRRRSGNV